MEDIVSLDLIGKLFRQKGKNLEEVEEKKILMSLEEKIVEFCKTDHYIQEISKNNGLKNLFKEVENDGQFKSAYKKFIEQHNLNIDIDGCNLTLALVIAQVLNRMLKNA